MKFLLRPSVRLFLGAQGVLYVLFLSRDLAGAGEGTAPLKYAAILLCLLFSLRGSLRGGDRLVTAALALTLGADTFLLLLNCRYVLGVALFCAVQGLYLLRIRGQNGGNSLWPLRLALALLALLALRTLGMLTPLNALALVYLVQFGCNAVQSLALTGPRAQLFSGGLVLFLCCDLCVGIFNQPELFPGALYRFARVGMWLFYLPSQVLITLSGLPDGIPGGTTHENQ